MSQIENLLQRLDGVQRSGAGWRAKCPGCGGQSRKLSITEADAGRILLHCFGGCGALDVVQAVGLSLADLFPERLASQTPEERRQAQRMARISQWGAALDELAVLARVVQIAAVDQLEGRPLQGDDFLAVFVAAERISDARSVLRDAPRYRPQVAA